LIIFQRAVRLRSMHNLPIFYVVTYVPQDIARRFTRKEMSGPSLYKLLRGEGFNFKAGKQAVSAALADPTVADGVSCNAMNCRSLDCMQECRTRARQWGGGSRFRHLGGWHGNCVRSRTGKLQPSTD